MQQSFFGINSSLCAQYPGMDPIRLLEHFCDDVFDLINGMVDYNSCKDVGAGNAPQEKYAASEKTRVILRRADDSWF